VELHGLLGIACLYVHVIDLQCHRSLLVGWSRRDRDPPILPRRRGRVKRPTFGVFCRARSGAAQPFPKRSSVMRIGLFTLGLGSAADADVIRAVAQTAERTGIATLWAAEHVVLFDRYESAYPYSPSGAFPLGAHADWLDPFVGLTFSAAGHIRV